MFIYLISSRVLIGVSQEIGLALLHKPHAKNRARCITLTLTTCAVVGIVRHDIPKYWIWLHYLSTFKYPLELMEDNEYRRRPDVCWTNGSRDLTGCNMKSSDVLTQFSAGGVHRWANILIMILFIVGCRIFFRMALKAQTAKLRK